jgi:hypothetical protein
LYYFLTEAVKTRFLMELRRYWSYHPKYRNIVDNIQGKYSFKQRPCNGIVLKTSSANQVQLSADNFQGTVHSFAHLAKVENYPGLAIEWIREDGRAIQDVSGQPYFPSPPGIYYIDLPTATEFYIDRLLDVWDEQLLQVDAVTYRAQNAWLEGTLQVYEMPGNLELYEGTNFDVVRDADGNPTGDLTLYESLPAGTYLSADYRYPGPSTGPFPVIENHANHEAIPGVVLAFGRRVEAGDRLAVVIHTHRQPTAMEYGGRWDISLDFDIVALDPYAQQEIADQTVMFLWGIARNRLSTEGIEVSEVSMGGETEEIYDENADDYYYNASFSVTVQTDWAIQVPLSATIRRLTPQTTDGPGGAIATAGMTDDELAAGDATSTLQPVEFPGLQAVEDPWFRNRTRTYEVIK